MYLAYGIAILALPFAILIGLITARQWRLLGAYAAAGLIAVLALSINCNGFAAPRWHFDLNDRLDTLLSQFLDDPRWIAMLAAVLTVSGPWLQARWRRWWWTLLLAFVPIHLVVSAVVPARSLLGLAVGWFVGALTVLVVGHAGAGGPARRRRAGAGPARIHRHGTDGGAPRRAGAAGARRARRHEPRATGRSSRCTARISAAAASCARSGDGAAAQQRDRARCTPRCGAPSSTAG